MHHSLLIAILLPAAALLPLRLASEPISSDEARAILRRSQPELPGAPGSYRHVFERDTGGGHLIRTTYLLVTPDHRSLSRTEMVEIAPGSSHERSRTVILTDDEGRWFVYPSAAILEPVANIEALLTVARERLGKPAGSHPPGPYLEAALEIERHATYARERMERNGRAVVVITETFDEERRQAIDALGQRILNDARSQFGPAKRLLVNAFLATVDTGSKLPANYEFEIDERSGRLRSTQITNRGGETRTRQPPMPRFAPTTALREADFVVPPQLPRLRPRSMAEFLELQREQEKRDAQTPRPATQP